MYTQADEIAMAEELEWQFSFHAERCIEDAYQISPRLDQHLRNFRVPIKLDQMRDGLKSQKPDAPKGYYERNGIFKGQDHFKSYFVNGMYWINADLRSDPRVFGVQRQLFIHDPSIKLREILPLNHLEGVEATLTSADRTLIVSYQELKRFDKYWIDKGFFVPDAELPSGEYLFGFRPTDQLKNVGIYI